VWAPLRPLAWRCKALAAGTRASDGLDAVVLETATRDLVHLSRHLHARGWVANHDGNVSCRLDDGRFLATPTAVSKGDVSPEMLVVLDAEGKVVAGTRRVFSEIALHMAVYRARPDVRWVVHAHPPHATAWAVSGRTFWEEPFLGEPVVSLGAEIPLVDTAEVGTAMTRNDAVLLASHGVLVAGPDAETARLRMELVEHLARIAAIAVPLGGPRALPHEEVERLLAVRGKAGLGPKRQVGVEASPGSMQAVDAAGLVREALKRFG
jgi:L-fuculose-phosphate aldolase